MMSDWGATHSTIPAALAGLTQQMPDAGFFGAALAAAVAAGNVTEADIDTMVMRILTPMFALNLISDPPTGNTGANAMSPEHNELARVLAENSTVLLRNEGGLLPLSPASFKSVLVLGDDSTFVGHGSGGVITPYQSTITAGITAFLNGPAPNRTLNCSFVNDTDFYQPGNPSQPASSAAECCAICTGLNYCNAFTYEASAGTCWLKPDNSGQRAAPGLVSGNCAPLPPNPNAKYTVTFNPTQNATLAAQLAATFDVVVMNLATTSGEGMDRADLYLPAWQDAMAVAVLAANAKTVIATRCPGACIMPWIGAARAVLFSLMPGQEAGNALANVLFGAVNPSGKLPISFPASMNDTWLSLPTPGGPINPQSFPGVPINGDSFPTAILYEGLNFGYRWYDSQGTTPQFEFGYGLSYTTFGYGALTVTGVVSSSSSATVSFTLTNTGAVTGSEVAQLYLGFPAAAGEPPKLLRGFEKLRDLAPGDAVPVSFTLTAAEVRIWDTVAGDWAITPGSYVVYVGSSSRDIRQTGAVTATA